MNPRQLPDLCNAANGQSVPCVDGSVLARTFFTSQVWSEQPCVRPVDAARMTAGHNALRGSGPGQKPAFKMRWHEWVVLITGSTDLHYVLLVLFQPSITPADRRDLAYRANAAGSL